MVLEKLLGELGRSTLINVNRQTWSKFESDLRGFFVTGKTFERYEKFNDEEWEEYGDREPFQFEECDFKAETETHYASFDLEFTLFGISPVLKPDYTITYALLSNGDALYFDFDPGDHHKMKRSQEIYVCNHF